MKIFLEEHL